MMENIVRRWVIGTKGRGVPVESSQSTKLPSICTYFKQRLVLVDSSLVTGQVACCSAKTVSSTTWGGRITSTDSVVVGGRDNTSAGTFLVPQLLWMLLPTVLKHRHQTKQSNSDYRLLFRPKSNQ